MPWWSKASTALTTPLGVKSIGASFTASRFPEYPVKLETETIGYIQCMVQVPGASLGIFKGNKMVPKIRFFRISSKGQVKSGALETVPGYYNHLPVLDIDTSSYASTTTQHHIDTFTKQTGLPMKNVNDMNALYGTIFVLPNGDFGKTEPIFVTDGNNPATTTLADGKQNAINESNRIRDAILTAALKEKNAADAAGAGATALNGAYTVNGQINADNLITVLTAVNGLATGGGAVQVLAANSIQKIVDAAVAEMPLLTDAGKIIAFLKSGHITQTICNNANFDDKTVALLFMVHANKIDVHFIKKRSIGDTHYISKSAKDILTISYTEAGADNANMMTILDLICLPVSFRVANAVNSPATITYGFRNRHTQAATLPHDAANTADLVYPFTSDSREVALITGRAINRQEAVVASAKFTNAPTIAKLTDLHGLLCDKKPEILTSDPCTAIQENIKNLQTGQTGGRRSRKRMNKNKRASSRHSRRHSRRHGHNSRKRYSAGSKSKSGLKSKSASKRRRNQRLQ
jgi:hypothetical protein